MRCSLLVVFAVSSIICLFECDQAEAQKPARRKPVRTEVRNVLNDYHRDSNYQYSPDDAMFRSKTFGKHTGQSGRYYNCDGEEAKRHSPYICWKTHFENDLPPRMRFWPTVKADIAEVRQRVMDGAGACYKGKGSGCDCADCRHAAAQSQIRLAGKSTRESFTSETQQAVASRANNKTSPIQVRHDDHGKSYGLVSGKILGTESKAPVEQMAKRSLLDQIQRTETPERTAAKPGSIMDAFRPKR